MSTTKTKRTRRGPTDYVVVRKQRFIRELAYYLVGNQVMKSIALQAGDEDAKQWATIRGTTPLYGYPTVGEAEMTLSDWLGIPLK